MINTKVISANEILKTMFAPEETVCLRVFEDKKAESNNDSPHNDRSNNDGANNDGAKKAGRFAGAKFEVPCGQFASIENTLRAHNAKNRGIFYTVNYGGHTDADITRINAQFVEMDEGTFEEQEAKIKSFPLPPSIIIKTRKSLHTYWLVKDAQVSLFRPIQKALVQWYGSDPACINESRVMRLPGFNHCKEEPIPVECILFHPERRYTQEEILNAMPISATSATNTTVERREGLEPGLELVVDGCDFIRYCRDEASSLPEPLWYAMITNLAPFDGGTSLIHEYSRSYPGYSETETQKKINHFLESGTRPMNCSTIADKGWACPKLDACGCKAPAAMCYKALGVEKLLDMVNELPITHNEVKDLQTASRFVKDYLYNQEQQYAHIIIKTMHDRFSFRLDIIRDLKALYKSVSKRYSPECKVVWDLPDWYVMTSKGLRFLPGALADYMAQSVNAFSLAGSFYIYSDGVYHEISDEEARSMVRENMITQEAKISQITDATSQWQILIQRSVAEVNAEPYVINLRNGLFNVLEDRITPHTPSYLSTIQLPVSYDPDATCPRFIQYLHEVLPEDQIPLIQEMLGYFLVPITKAQKSFLIVGAGGAGKSVLLRVLNEILLGQENVSNVSWQALNERFKTAEVYGKLANIFADLPTKNIEDNGIFKALVGEDYITAEKKNKNPFSFQNTARLLFSCNTIPKNYGDKSEGFYRRLIIIRFDHAVPEEKRDKNLIDKFRKEADGIFMFALEGLNRLMENGFVFSETATNRDELQRYREESDSILSFIRDCCISTPDEVSFSSDLFSHYRDYCTESGLKPYSQKKFVQMIIDHCPGTERGLDNKRHKRTIKGIKYDEPSVLC